MEEQINQVLDYVCEVSGESELPVRTTFELVNALNRLFFSRTQKSSEA